MFRSGTSYMAECLHKAGIQMWGWKTSHAEDGDVWAMNAVEDQTNPPNTRRMPYQHEPSEHLMARLLEYRRRREEEAEGQPWGFKEPKVAEYMGVYKKVFPDAKWLVCVRNPAASVMSQVNRGKMPDARTGMLTWASYYLNLILQLPEDSYIFNYDGNIAKEEAFVSVFVGRQVELAGGWKRALPSY